MGIEPTLSAWKAEVLPLNYTRNPAFGLEGEGFEPSKAEPSDLQSDPFDRSGTPPSNKGGDCLPERATCQALYVKNGGLAQCSKYILVLASFWLKQGIFLPNITKTS